METVIQWNVYYNLGLAKIVNNLLILLEWFGHLGFWWAAEFLQGFEFVGSSVVQEIFHENLVDCTDWGLCLAITKLFCPFAFVCSLEHLGFCLYFTSVEAWYFLCSFCFLVGFFTWCNYCLIVVFLWCFWLARELWARFYLWRSLLDQVWFK